jgi:hypothetical protein
MVHKLKTKLAEHSTPCANKRSNPCLASSSPSWAFDSSSCADSQKSPANGRWFAWRGT